MNKKSIIKMIHMAEEATERKWRLKFHITPKNGYLGNPCGIAFKEGEYHIFYQYSPFDISPQQDFWGHFITKDFINYKRADPILFCDSIYDCNGLGTGTVLYNNDNLTIFYAGFVKQDREFTNIILSEYSPSENPPKKTPLLNISDYPENESPLTGDPAVWTDDREYFLLLGTENSENGGEALLYKSADMHNWVLKNIISPSDYFSGLWISPQYFVLDGVKFISISYTSPHIKSGYMPFDGDISSGYRLAEFKEFDFGFDFFAPKIFKDHSGRVILIARMGIPDSSEYSNPTEKYGWTNALTFPRQISQRNGKILQYPLDELSALRKSEKIYEFSGKTIIDDALTFDCIVTGENLHLVIRNSLEITCRNDKIIINLKNNGYGRGNRSIPCKALKNIRILADISSVEIFINEGESVFTTRYYPENNDIGLFAEGENVTLTFWKMNEFNYI